LKKKDIQKKIDAAFNEGHEAGYDLALQETQNLTRDEFAFLAYTLGMDSKIGHRSAGVLMYKLVQHIDEQKVTIQD
jgi:hypothetical protein